MPTKCVQLNNLMRYVSGTSNAERITEYVHSMWSNLEMDLVELNPYHDVLLSHPDHRQPNMVQIIAPSEDSKRFSVSYICASASPSVLPNQQANADIGLLWNAYSGQGTVIGKLVYANYGRRADFSYLLSRGIRVQGRIVLIREGELWRGAKVLEAEAHGALGVLLYSDPADAAHEGGYPGTTYPYNAWMPPFGARLGSLYMSHGDPFSPGFPAKNYTYRSWTESELTTGLVLPVIPVQPITYEDAAVLMTGLGGAKAPRDWVGNLPGVKVYRIGPGFHGARKHKTNENRYKRQTTSLRQDDIGEIKNYSNGSVEQHAGESAKMGITGTNSSLAASDIDLQYSSGVFESLQSSVEVDSYGQRLNKSISAIPPSSRDFVEGIKSNSLGPNNPSLLNFPSKQEQRIMFAKSNRVRVSVNSDNHRGSVVNVIAHLVGKKYPDELVILGNHRDAWTYGSIDPHSATSLLLEIAVLLSEARESSNSVLEDNPSLVAKLVKRQVEHEALKEQSKSWAPSRTIVLCSWDGEEFGQIGSTEWVEEHLGILQARTVAYLNVDHALSGNLSLSASASPMLYEALVAAARSVENPDPKEIRVGRMTLYDTWKYRNPGTGWGPLAFDPLLPSIEPPAADSDHWPFLQFAGVSVASFRYNNLQYEHPLHHTLYETIYANERLVDPFGLAVSTSVGRFWLDLTLRLSESTVLPMNVTHYANFIADGIRRHINPAVGRLRPSLNVDASIQRLNRAAQTLVKTASYFDTLRAAMMSSGPLDEEAAAQLFWNVMGNGAPQSARLHRIPKKRRRPPSVKTEEEQRRDLISRINSRLIGFERNWLANRAAPLPQSDRALEHHLIFGTASNGDRHRWRLFPGVMTAADQYLSLPKSAGKDNRAAVEHELRLQISHLQWAIESAVAWLRVNRKVERNEHHEYEEE